MNNKIFFQYKNVILKVFFFTIISTAFTQTDITVTVQPYEGAEFFADGKKMKPAIVKKDKTLAQMLLTVKTETECLEIKKLGYRTARFFKTKLFSNTPLFAVLSKEHSEYDVIKVFPTGSKPKSAAFINEHTVAVALLDGEGVQLIDIETGKTRLIAPPEKYAQKTGFVESLVLHEKKELWVSQMSTGCIHIFSTDSFKYKTTVQTSGNWSKVIALNPKENRIYVSHWISKNISIINPDTYKEEKIIDAQAVPRGIAFSANGKHIYFAQFEDADGVSNGRLIKKELNSLQTIKEMGVRGAKRHIVTDGTLEKLFVSDMLNAIVEIYSLKNDTLLKTVKVFSNPNTIKLSPDGKYLYVSCRGPNNPKKGYLYKGFVMGRLDIIDTETMTRIESIEAGNQPTALDVSPDGKTIVLSDFLDNRIRVFKKH